MLRVDVYCSLLSSARQVKLVDVGSTSLGSWQIQQCSAQRPPRRISVKAVKDGTGGETSGFRGQNWEPESEIEVPFEQRPALVILSLVKLAMDVVGHYPCDEDVIWLPLLPGQQTYINLQIQNKNNYVYKVNEYSSLKEGTLYSWGDLGPGPFFLRLGGLWLGTFTVLGAPIAAASFNPARDPLRFVLTAGTGTLFLVSLIVLRIYLGWSYVGDRLLSAVIPYEETGWYDGQMWVKPPEVLARDRLLGSYKVKPVIKLLKQTLVGTGVLLVSAVMLFIFATPVEEFIQTTFSTRENSSNVSVSKMRREELLKLPVEVKSDDDLAAAAAEAADGRPVYCRDRFYRALAGGQYCKSDDLLMK